MASLFFQVHATHISALLGRNTWKVLVTQRRTGNVPFRRKYDLEDKGYVCIHCFPLKCIPSMLSRAKGLRIPSIGYKLVSWTGNILEEVLYSSSCLLFIVLKQKIHTNNIAVHDQITLWQNCPQLLEGMTDFSTLNFVTNMIHLLYNKAQGSSIELIFSLRLPLYLFYSGIWSNYLVVLTVVPQYH